MRFWTSRAPQRFWREEGREAGRAEGREAGRAEGQRDAVRLALESRFGPLDSATAALLNEANSDSLRSVLTHVATDSREQLRARLGLVGN